MRNPLIPLLATTLTLGGWACAGRPPEDRGGNATVTIAGKTFAVSHVKLTYAVGDDGYFRVEGDDAAHPDQDCLTGLAGGLALYGDLPASITSAADLAGKELPFEFTGDGDDANLCFVGSNGLLGVEEGTVRFTAVEGTKVSFSFSGSFVIYDGEGGESPSAVPASGSGIAHVGLD
jgi:hypothetical protein